MIQRLPHRGFLVASIATSIVLASSAGPLRANGPAEVLTSAISEHRLRLAALEQEAAKRKAPHAGTAFNEFGLAEFVCASLALMLGKTEIYERLSTIDKIELTPDMDELELQGLSIQTNIYRNWISAAESVLAQSDRDRAENWNLSCVRRHGIGEEHSVARTAPNATFDVRGDQLHVFGDIEPGFYERFRAALAHNTHVKVVHLGSGGGSVRDAILSGLLIRQRKLNTGLFADCYSACPLIYLGGVNREVWSPYPRLGFHQVSRDGAAVPPDDDVYNLIGDYASEMGASRSHVLTLMHQSPPQDMNYPDVWELCEPGITTWVQRGC